MTKLDILNKEFYQLNLEYKKVDKKMNEAAKDKFKDLSNFENKLETIQNKMSSISSEIERIESEFYGF